MTTRCHLIYNESVEKGEIERAPIFGVVLLYILICKELGGIRQTSYVAHCLSAGCFGKSKHYCGEKEGSLARSYIRLLRRNTAATVGIRLLCLFHLCHKFAFNMLVSTQLFDKGIHCVNNVDIALKLSGFEVDYT